MQIIKELMIKGGIREGFREGTSKLADRPCYGYTKSGNGKLVIHEIEAATVRWIFQRYLNGNSLGRIADGLALQSIPSPSGNPKWNRQAIDKLLSNEKYMGYAMLQKTVTENGRQICNDGLVDKYLYHNNNPAIITKEMFHAVREEKLRRSKKQQTSVIQPKVHDITQSM